MTHENAPESTESDAGPESGPAFDGGAQGAREASYAEAIDAGRVNANLTGEGYWAEVMDLADAELAPLRARVAELEAERDASVNAHARAIVQLSEWMERVEGAEADLVNAWLAVEEVADEVDRGGSLADYIRSLAAAGPAVCGARHPDDASIVPCVRDTGHEGSHMSTTGCGGSIANWPAVSDGEGCWVQLGNLPRGTRSLRKAALSRDVSDGEGATSEVAILSGVVLSAAGGIAATAAAASEQANVAKSLAAECQPRPQSDYDRARHAVAELRTKAGFVLGDVIATLVLDSGVVVPPSPVVAPSATDEDGA